MNDSFFPAVKDRTMNTWRIEPAGREHLVAIARDMREADRWEVWASGRRGPYEALEWSFAGSDRAWTCLIGKDPICMWGVGRAWDKADTGVPWLLGTSRMEELRRALPRYSRGVVEDMQQGFRRLENFVHGGNRLSMRWLRWCGFSIADEAELINDEHFFRFWREK